MAFEPEFLDLMPNTVTIFPAATRNQYGETTVAATGVAMRAHVTYGNQRAISSTGERVKGSVKVILGGVYAAITPEDRVKTPDGVTRDIVDIQLFSDEEGPHHQSLVLT